MFTGQQIGDELRAFVAHDGATKSTMMLPIYHIERFGTVGTQLHINILDPWHY